MEPDIKQDLSLLPGGYYHPEAELEKSRSRWPPGGRGHRVDKRKHGLWEYTVEGRTFLRNYWFEGLKHGPSYDYNYPEGTLVKSEFYYRGDVNGFIFPSLFQAATGLPHFPFVE
jgi:hypothetical protein